MQKNIILAGVGGQGILSVAYVIDNAALDAGYYFKQAEVHGMAQRGGAVQSNLRYADTPVHSDLIPTGRADMILAVEPLEALRYRQYLSPEGWVVSSITPFVNIPDYPELATILDALTSYRNVLLVDSKRIAAAAGNLRTQNTVMVGAASNLLDFTEDQLLTHVRSLFARKGDKIVGVNEKAFGLGRTVGAAFRAFTSAGAHPATALALCGRFDPAAMEATGVAAWAEAIAADPQKVEVLARKDGELPWDAAAALAVA